MKKSAWIIIGLVAVLSVIYFLTRDDQVSVGIKRLSLPSFSLDKIDRIEVLGKDAVNIKKEGDQWLVDVGDKDHPRFVKAEETSVKEALEAAAEIKHSHYVTNLKDKYGELGVEGTEAVTVKLYANGAVLWAIVLGKNANNAGRYAKLAEGDDVHVVRGAFFRITRAGASDWRNREIVPVKDTALSAFVLEKANVPYISLVREGETWNLDKAQKVPTGFRVDQGALLAFVRTTTSLRAQGFVDQEQVLNNPLVTIKAIGEKETTTVDFFKGSDDKYLARRSGDTQIYEVGKNAFDRVNKTLDDLRDLKLLSFDKAAVKKLSLKHGKDLIEIEKKDNQWQFIKPATQPADFEFDETAVEDMISMLSGLSAQRIAQAGKDTALNASWLKDWVVELELNKGEKVHLFAAKNKGNSDEHVVKGNIDNEVYVMRSARLSSLNGGVNAFKKEALEMPPVNENTKGFDSLPPDVKQKLLDAMKNRQ